MSDAVVPVGEAHQPGDQHEAHHGGSLGFYIGLAIFLAIVTGLEIWIVSDTKGVNHAGNEDLVRTWLTIFSIAKFVGVVAFFMHLYYDRKLLTFLFTAGLITAACTMVALLHLIPTPINEPPDEKMAASADTAMHTPTPLPPPRPKGDPKKGQQLVVKFGCTACHNMPGNDPPAAPLCPDQHGLATRAATREPGKDAEAYIRESIEKPDAFIVPGFQNIMPPLRKKMTDQEFEDIVAYLMTLK